MHGTARKGDSPMPVYHAVTPGKLKEFKEFQKNLHLVIEFFLEVTPGVKNLFLTKWNIKSTANLADIAFRNISKKLQLKDLLDYQKQIQTIPGFDKYIMFMDNKNNSSGFLYQVQDLDSMRANEENIGNKTVDTQATDIIPNVETGLNESLENGYDNTDRTDDTITTNPKPYKVCYSSDSDIHALLQELWPSIMAYIHTTPIHQQSIQWKTWISQGLHCTSSLNQVKTIMGIETIVQLYLTLRDSEAVNTTYNVNWDHEIQYSRKVTEEADHNFKAIKYEPDNHATKHTVITMSDMDKEISVLHRKLFNIVQQWASTNQMTQNDMFIQWKKWTFAGLKPIMSAKK
jgi:hypothetical protein